MRRWKRVETRDGPRFRSSLAPHEAALLKNLAGAMIGLLDDRDSSSPSDELEEITGIKTGHAQRPGDPTLRRLLPDFYRPDDLDDDDPTAVDGSESFNAALRSLHEPEIIDAKRVAAQQLLDGSGQWRPVGADGIRRQCLDRRRQRPSAGARSDA